MGDRVIVVRFAGRASVQFVPGRKIAPLISGWHRLPAGREDKPPGVDPVRRRVPIRIWQTHSWTKKIVEVQVCPASVEKARTPRPRGK